MAGVAPSGPRFARSKLPTCPSSLLPSCSADSAGNASVWQELGQANTNPCLVSSTMLFNPAISMVGVVRPGPCEQECPAALQS